MARPFLTSILALLGLSLLSPAIAETREDLFAQMVMGGHNEYKDERHAVEVNECQLTTCRWKHVENKGWVLWTSFEFPMLLVDLVENTSTPETDHFIAVDGDPAIAIIAFKAKDPFEFTHEKSVLRKPKGETERSERGDGTTQYIERKSEGLIVQQGPDVIKKARLFTDAYLRYARRYCLFTG